MPGRCYLHQGVASLIGVDDPIQRLAILQNVAELRALRAAEEAGGEPGSDKADAAFCRNARLAASLARLRYSLLRTEREAKAERAADAAGGGDGSARASADVTIYHLPDNGRDPKKV